MKPKNTLTAFLRSLSFCIYFLLLAFTTGDSKSEYILPPMAASVCSGDIDLDGNMDIVVGHIFSASIDWTGITMMINNGDGYFTKDTFFLNGQHREIVMDQLDANDEPDLITQYYDGSTSKIGVLFDFSENQNNLTTYDLVSYADYIRSGEINGDGHTDIVIASNNGHFWAVLYNDGAGSFSEPEYYYSQYWYIDLAVSDIDGNGRDDIALCGPDTEIYFSFDTGFEYYVLSESEHDIEISDMDKDGDMDIITIWGGAFATFILYENLGYQNFNQHIIFSFEGAAGGLRVPDLNNDSLPEITFGYGTKYYVLYNKSGFEFLEPDTILPNFPGSIDYTWEDADNNQFQDIIMVCSGDGSAPNLKILFNDGNGNFGDNPVTSVESTIGLSQISNLQCYPNPFKKETTIVYSIEKICTIELLVYNVTGEIISKLKKEIYYPGVYKSIWNGTDKNVKEVEPGTYLLTLKVIGNAIQTAKLIKH